MIANLLAIGTETNRYSKPEISRRVAVFSFLPSSALWNACPVKHEVCFSGAEPIPPGSAERKKKLCVLCVSSDLSGRSSQSEA